MSQPSTTNDRLAKPATKTRPLNALAKEFKPPGHSAKASSRCKVMETIREPSGQEQVITTDTKIQSLSNKTSSNNDDSIALPWQLRKSVFVSRDITDTIIPQTIAEDIHDIYNYMDKSMVFNDNKLSSNNGKSVIVNFGFHEKKSNEELFCVLEKQNSGQRIWRMLNELFTAQMIQDGYNISRDDLPKRHKYSGSKWSEDESLDPTPTICNKMLQTKWNRIPVHGKKNNKLRQVLHITNNEFISKIKQKINDIHHQHTIPIIGRRGLMINGLRVLDLSLPDVQHVMIIDLTEEVSIGISYAACHGTVEITGIYLDKEEILLRHQLYNPQHECHCLDNFKSNINDLKIGNVYNERNTIKNLKSQNKVLTEKHKNPIIKYIKQVLNEVNDLISKDMQKVWSAIQQIFNVNTIKNAMNNCRKSSQKNTIKTHMPTSNDSNLRNIPISYLTTICGSYATTTPLPPPPLNAALRSIPQQQ